MKSFSGGVILVSCVVITIITVLATVKIHVIKQVLEDYIGVAFVAEPYLSSLSMMKVNTPGCGEVEVYELMARAAAENSAEACGVNLNTELAGIHESFMSEFGTDYYIALESADTVVRVILPGVPTRNVTVVSQMPIPVPGGNVTRVTLLKLTG